jgi:hypothetical protein
MRAAVTCGLLLLGLSNPCYPDIVDPDTLQCSQGDKRACRLIELRSKINLRQIEKDKSLLVKAGPVAQWTTARDLPSGYPADDRIRRGAILESACTFYTEVVPDDPDLREWEQLAEMRIVNRAAYTECFRTLWDTMK